MSVISISLGTEAREYAAMRLADGLGLSRKATLMLDGMTTEALVPAGVTVEQARDFRHGGLGRLQMGAVAEAIVQRYGDATFVIELPLWRHTDPVASEYPLTIRFCGEQVYAAAHLREPAGGVEAAMRAADPSFMYNAFVLRRGSAEPLVGCPVDWLDATGTALIAVIVGAYDGEGFVHCSRGAETEST